MNTGTLAIGVLQGLTVGLLAVGLVLVYKANRFLNLAHAQLGALPAALLGKAVLEWDIPFWPAFLGAVALGSATALAAERLVIAPVRARSDSPLRLLLLTVGLSQLLLALAFVPWFTPDPKTRLPYPQPFTSSVEVGGVILQGMDVLTVLLVPVLVAGLGAFLKLSSLGKQIRAAASNPDAARTCGVSVRRVSALTWGLAGGLATVSAVLAAPGQATFQAAALGPGLLLVTLGAAALGAFVSLPAAMAGGLAIGIVGQVVTAETSSAGSGQLAVFLLILGFIVVRAKAISKVFAHTGVPVAERTITRVPEVLRDHPVVRHQRRLVVGAGLAIAVIAPFLPGLNAEADRFRLVQVVVFCLVGVSLTMLLGWAGQISLGHGFVVGVGAFVTARLVPHGLPLPVLLVVAAVVGAALLTITGLPALRVPGFTLSVVTLGVAVVGPAWLFHQEWFGTDRPNQVAFDAPAWPRGLGAVTDQLGTYYLAVMVLAAGLAAASALRRSVPGRLVVAVRDNEDAVATYGVAPASVKLAILATSGAFAACGGVLWATTYRLANEGHFTPDLSIAILAIPVIGGLGSLSGSVTSAVMLYGSTYFLTPHLTGLLGDFAQNAGVVLFLAGFGLVTTIMWVPAGLAGAAQNAWQQWLNRAAAKAGDAGDGPAPVKADSGISQSIDIAVVETTPPTTDDDRPPTSGLVVRQIDRLIGEPVAGLGDMPLAVDDLHLRFGGITALDGATLQVRPGEIVGLIGPNGAGKTTLMNVVSGMLWADSGSVKLFGHEVSDLAPDLRSAFGLARSFQHAALFAELTVLETIQVAISRRWMVRFLPAMVSAPWSRYADAATEAEAEEIIERFGLSAWRDTLCGQLSTGSRRICDLAAQVAARPKLMLLDEPTGGVAQREAEAFGPLVRRVRDELDCSILVVEHDMPLLMGLCDRIYAMESGHVIAEGTPEEVRNDPRVIATYLGTDDVAITRSGSDLEGSPV